jgi:hypothetical protein
MLQFMKQMRGKSTAAPHETAPPSCTTSIFRSPSKWYLAAMLIVAIKALNFNALGSNYNNPTINQSNNQSLSQPQLKIRHPLPAYRHFLRLLRLQVQLQAVVEKRVNLMHGGHADDELAAHPEPVPWVEHGLDFVQGVFHEVFLASMVFEKIDPALRPEIGDVGHFHGDVLLEIFYQKTAAVFLRRGCWVAAARER